MAEEKTTRNTDAKSILDQIDELRADFAADGKKKAEQDAADAAAQREDIKIIEDADEAMSIAREHTDRVNPTISEIMVTRGAIVKDFSTAGLAVLGALLTVITVAPYLIKTPLPIYIGATIVSLVVIGCFFVRYKTARYVQSELFHGISEVYRIKNPAMAVRREPRNPVLRAAFYAQFNNQVAGPSFPNYLDRAIPVLGIGLLFGVALIVIGVLLKIST